MYRLALLGLVLAACGTTVDDRPATLPYIAETILAPTCSAATCHAAFTQARGDEFDTIDATRKSLVINGLVSIGSLKYPGDETAPGDAQLITWLTSDDPFGLKIGRMPYDAPMPDEDVKFLIHWIGIGAPGGQCVPADGDTCVGQELYPCDPDGNYGPIIKDCQALGMKCRRSEDLTQPAACGPVQ